ncbi:hypothetical protein CsSME_00041117 [Camellia sinensis var. sinensis]
MREFSKSLTDRAFSWYANLAAGSISSWENLVKKFYIKFFYVEEREKTVDIQDPMEEHQLVSLCIEGMLTTYKLQLHYNPTHGDQQHLNLPHGGLTDATTPYM